MRPVSIAQIGPPNIHRLGAAKNRRAPTGRWEHQRPRERGRPRPHQPDNQPYDPLRSHKSCVRTLTDRGRARMPALLHALEKATALWSAAVLGRINPTTDPTTRFNHTNPPPDHSPVGGGEESPRSSTRSKKQRPRERGRPRPHQPDNRPCTSFDHTNPAPDHSPAVGGQECPRSCTRWKKQRPRERGRPRPHRPDD